MRKEVVPMRIMAAGLLVLALTTTALGQAPTASPAQRDAMKRLDFLIGQWRGGGWIEREGKRYEFTSTETIQSKLGGVALLIEGVHTRYEALAILTYDDRAQTYKWRSYTTEGRGADVDAALIGPRTLRWGREGAFRYTIAISED